MFCPLPPIDVDGKKFLPIHEFQRLMDNGSSLSYELKDLEKLRGKFKNNKDELAKRKEVDGKLGKHIYWSKVRKVQKYDECMTWCFFSRYAHGTANVPKNKHYDAVQRHVETNGYRCGDLVQL